MKKFINEHPKLYWVIVGLVALLVFGLVTLKGCVKLEKAYAAEPQTIVVPWHGDNYEVSTEGYIYYLMVVGINGGENSYLFLSNDFISASETLVGISIRNKTNTDVLAYGVNQSESFEGSSIIWNDSTVGYSVKSYSSYFSNYDVCNSDGEVIFPANLYVPPAEYSSSAPYVVFRDLNVVNKIASDDTSLGVFSNLYDDYIKTAQWEYVGKLNNFDYTAGAEYQLEIDFTVELPTDVYIETLWSNENISLEWEHNFLNYAPSAIRIWNLDSNASKRVYEFKHIVNVVPDLDGSFTFALTFDDIALYMQYFNESFRESFSGYSEYWRSVVLSFMHVRGCGFMVKTTMPNEILYGPATYDTFSRGIYDTCIEAIIDFEDYVGGSDEEKDEAIKDAIQSGYEEYIAELERQIEELQNSQNVAGVLTPDGNGLWDAIKGVGSGLLGLTGFLGAFATVIGRIFAFLPYDVQQIAGYFFIVTLVIALWKLIKR